MSDLVDRNKLLFAGLERKSHAFNALGHTSEFMNNFWTIQNSYSGISRGDEHFGWIPWGKLPRYELNHFACNVHRNVNELHKGNMIFFDITTRYWWVTWKPVIFFAWDRFLFWTSTHSIWLNLQSVHQINVLKLFRNHKQKNKLVEMVNPWLWFQIQSWYRNNCRY